MNEQFLAFDIETAQTDIPEGDDLMDHLSTLGISCVATLTSEGLLRTWNGLLDRMIPQQCRNLVQYLQEMNQKGYVIVGFNSCSFDFRVLAQESGMWETCKTLAWDHIDIGFAMFAEKGFMPKLQNIALGMGLRGKSGEGKDAPRMWAQGKREEVLRYVAQDVEVTMSVFQEIQKRGCVEWVMKNGYVNTWTPSSGRLFTVREAMKLPLPDQSWMRKPWKREKFTGWLKE